MNIYIDVPKSFSVSSYHDHFEIREIYQRIISAAVDLGLDLRLNTALNSSGRSNEISREDGIYYAYHARETGPNTYCIKASALPGRWYFDADGYSGWCRLANDAALQKRSAEYSLVEADAAIERYRQRFLDENVSRLSQPNADVEPEIANLRDYVFYPLQVNVDEVLKLGPFAQFEIVGTLARLAEVYRRHVVLKRHPLCDSEAIDQVMDQVASHPYLHGSAASVHRLIAGSRAVLVSNSGVGLEALIHGKPVYSLARSEYAHMTTRVAQLDDLSHALLSEPTPQSELVRRQLGYLINEYWVDITSVDSIARRISDHMKAFADATSPSAADNVLGTATSILHRVKRELDDIVDVILLSYPQLTVAQKDRMAPVLARAASNGLKSELILRKADQRVWRRAMHLLRRAGDLAAAEAFARRIIEQDAQDSEALVTLAKLLYAGGARTEGFEAARRAATTSRPTPDALVYFGRRLLAESKGEVPSALDCANRALEQAPELAVAHWLKARALTMLGDIETAWASSTIAVGLAPDSVQFMQLHDQIAKRLKRQEDDEVHR